MSEPDEPKMSKTLAVWFDFATIATVVEAVEVEVTEKTAYGEEEPIEV